VHEFVLQLRDQVSCIAYNHCEVYFRCMNNIPMINTYLQVSGVSVWYKCNTFASQNEEHITSSSSQYEDNRNFSGGAGPDLARAVSRRNFAAKALNWALVSPRAIYGGRMAPGKVPYSLLQASGVYAVHQLHTYSPSTTDAINLAKNPLWPSKEWAEVELYLKIKFVPRSK